MGREVKRVPLDFETLEALAEWCEENFTIFANIKATKTEWLEMILAQSHPECLEPKNRFEKIKLCPTPADMAVLLNGDARRFCPKEYGTKPNQCEEPCGQCIVQWLEEPTP